MTIDLASLTPGQVAILTASASIVAAITAGVFALVVALVNAWSTRKMARENALREYLKATLKPCMDALLRIKDEMYLTYRENRDTTDVDDYVNTLNVIIRSPLALLLVDSNVSHAYRFFLAAKEGFGAALQDRSTSEHERQTIISPRRTEFQISTALLYSTPESYLFGIRPSRVGRLFRAAKVKKLLRTAKRAPLPVE